MAYSENYEAVNLQRETEAKILKKLNIKARQEEARQEREKRYFSFLSQASNLLNINLFEDAIELLNEAKSIEAGIETS